MRIESKTLSLGQYQELQLKIKLEAHLKSRDKAMDRWSKIDLNSIYLRVIFHLMDKKMHT
jgi:hypothetical protein